MNVCVCVVCAVWNEIWIWPMFHSLCNTQCWQCFGNWLILGARSLWLLIFEYLSPMGWLPSNNVAKWMFNHHQFSTVLKSFPFNNFDFDKCPSNEKRKRKWRRKVDAGPNSEAQHFYAWKSSTIRVYRIDVAIIFVFLFSKTFSNYFRFHVNYYYSFENIKQYTVENPLLFL